VKKLDTVIIGAGPAGLMAGIRAAEHGRRAIILEKNKIVGKKLRITGKGRCNITNSCDFNELIPNIPGNGKFMYSALRAFSNTDLISFIESLGVKTLIERGNRVFPQSGKASDVAEALLKCALNHGVIIKYNEKVIDVVQMPNRIFGIKTNNGLYKTDKFILATGGLSYPGTGSTGDGYRIAKKLGHSIIAPKPSLISLVSSDIWISKLHGLSLRNISFELLDNENKSLYKDFGELLFTKNGISGPVVLSGSRHIPNFIYNGITARIDLKPALDEQKLDCRLQRDFYEFSRKQLKNSLGDLLPSKLIPVFINLSGIPDDKPVNQITKMERQKILSLLKNFTLSITGSGPIEEAIVTAGGVAVSEINPSTMESKIVPGLFFAGEIIDVDGYTGGFNLTIAFSTGSLAGYKI
jgi:predicted Rossmann fold flavoprotein